MRRILINKCIVRTFTRVKFALVMFLIAVLFLVNGKLTAQIPPGYYASATGTGFTLKTQLHNIIKNQTVVLYSDLWTGYYYTDRDTDGSILDMYSENPSGTDPYNYTWSINQCGSYLAEGDCYNREHSFPKSWWGGSILEPMYTDIHHIVPSDGQVNNWRNNYPFGETTSPSITSLNGCKLGPGQAGLGYAGTVFEPLDEYKGDFARIYFYMATRYEDVLSTWVGSPMLDGTTDTVYTNWALTMLLDWHNNDPVSAKEISRNDSIYKKVQLNRNPFVDHPEWVEEIWKTCTLGNPVGTGATRCDSGNVTLSAIPGSGATTCRWYDASSGGTLLHTGTTFTTNVSSTTLFYVTSYDGSCESVSTAVSATIHEFVGLGISGLSSDYCISAPSVNMVGSPSGGVFSGNGVAGTNFSSSLAGAGTHEVLYIVSDTACIDTAMLQVTVSSNPIVDFSGLDSVYSDTDPQATLIGSPSGGTFSGSGMVGDTFFPLLAGLGNHNITYSYVNGVCNSSETKNVRIENQVTSADGDLLISGVFDGPLSGGHPKGIELYVINAIPDLSIYGVGSANNGTGTDGEEFTFPAISVTAGTFIYIVGDSAGFINFTGFNADYISGAANINGDDAIELFCNGAVVDLFGDINVDGTGQPWEHLDGWAARKKCTGPDSNTFILANWNFSGVDALDFESSNATAATPIPLGTYEFSCPTCSDGLQNGSETGIDCGGSCSACPTCSDGLQNGDETGVDCGGSTCSACPTCSDGLQNGDETGVDCGGSTCSACPTCSDGFQNGDETEVDCGGSTCSACPTCSDGLQNGDETGVDCGGSTCSACPTCSDGFQNGDETGVDCGGSTCPACPTCSDGLQNGDETGVDCGGSTCSACPTCSDGFQNGDETGVDCGGSTCSACPTCTDGFQNGDETGVDCGGSTCSACPTCSDGLQNGDETGVDCGGSTCPACPTCSDGLQNGDETGVDCGGSTCPACPTCLDGLQNGDETGVDCGGSTCPACPTCSDGLQNGDETGVDCGGSTCPVCPTCSDGLQNGDETGVDCGGLTCPVCPTCSDGLQNGDETGVDCGGSTCSACPTCSDGLQNGDETGVDCGGSTCPACPTCSDGLQNGDETGVDCGGSTCPACPTCSDGLQNGDETGVDCGGLTCPVCPTCSDGLQNGDETGIDCGGSCLDSCVIDGIQDVNQLEVKIYPNPFSENCTIEIAGRSSLNSNSMVYYDLVDVNGRKVWSHSSNKSVLVLERTNLEDGLYLLIIRNTTGSSSKKISIYR